MRVIIQSQELKEDNISDINSEILLYMWSLIKYLLLINFHLSIDPLFLMK